MHRQRSANELYSRHHCLYLSFFFQDGCTPLHLACSNRESEIVDILLSAGAMPDIMENVTEMTQ